MGYYKTHMDSDDFMEKLREAMRKRDGAGEKNDDVASDEK